jgi:hypothetical protein
MTVARFLRRGHSHWLNRFVFKSIPNPEARTALAADLGDRRVEELDGYLNAAPDVARGVSAFLSDRLRGLGYAANADEWIGPMEVSWSAWLAASPWLTTELWPSAGVSDFDLWKALGPDWIDPRRDLRSNVGREALHRIAGHLKGKYELRGEVSYLLAQMRDAAGADEPALMDLRHLEGWYTRIRYRAIATQHNAVFVQSVDEGENPFGSTQRYVGSAAENVSNESRVELPDEILSGLANLDDQTWRRLVGQNLALLSRWWSQGRLDDFRQVASAVAGVISPPKSITPFGMFTAIPVVAAGLSGVAVGEAGASAAVTGGVTALVTAGSGFAIGAKRTASKRRVQRRIVDAARPFATSRARLNSSKS